MTSSEILFAFPANPTAEDYKQYILGLSDEETAETFGEEAGTFTLFEGDLSGIPVPLRREFDSDPGRILLLAVDVIKVLDRAATQAKDNGDEDRARVLAKIVAALAGKSKVSPPKRHIRFTFHENGGALILNNQDPNTNQ